MTAAITSDRASQIAAARRYRHELEELFSKSTSGFSLYHSVLESRRLCSAAWLAVDDNTCREQIDMVELYAQELFQAAAQRDRRPGGSGRIEALSSTIHGCLEIFESRLAMLDESTGREETLTGVN